MVVAEGFIATAIVGGIISGGTAMVIQGIIYGAILGAVLGGLTAAISGGDIGDGILFGAIGGAVTGGLGAYLSLGASTATSAATSSANQALIGAEGVGWGGTVQATSPVIAPTTAANLGSAATGASITSELGGSIIKTGIQGYLTSEAASDARDDAKEAAILARQHDLDKLKLQASLQRGTDNTGAILDYEASMAQLDQRKIEFDTSTSQYEQERSDVQNLAADRRASFESSGGRRVDTSDASGGGGTSVLAMREADAPTALTGPTQATTSVTAPREVTA